MSVPSHSLSVANALIQKIMLKFWQQIATVNVRKMAPKSTFQESTWTIASFVLMGHCEKEQKQMIRRENEPINSKIDCFGSSYLDMEEKKSTILPNPIEEPLKIIRKNSKNKVITDKNALIEISVLEECFNDEVSDKLRKKRTDKDKDALRLKIAIAEKEKERIARRQRDQKIIQGKKGVSFDYEGKFIGTSSPQLPNEKPINLKPSLEDSKNLGGSERKIEVATIQKQKSKQKEVKASKFNRDEVIPIFPDEPINLTDGLADVSEGIKITEEPKNKQKIIKEKRPRKLSGIKEYRLKDFKNYSKDIHFKEYNRKGKSVLNFTTLDPISNVEESLTSPRVSIKNSSLSQMRMPRQSNLDAALGRKLPFIRTKGYRMYDIGTEMETLKKLDYSRLSHRSSQKSTIRVQNELLFENNFQ